jgi:hypothetical protein
MATPVSGVNDWVTLNGQPLRFDPNSDNLAAGAVEYDYNRLRLTRSAPDELEIRVDGKTLETEVYGRWDWRPAGFAGLYELIITAPKHGTHRTQVRVLPSHLSHRRYEQMLKEIGEFSVDLLFQLHSPASERVATDLIAQLQSPLRTYKLVSSLMDELTDALTTIERAPHQALVSQGERKEWHEVRELAGHAVPLTGPSVLLTRQNRLPHIWPQQWQVERAVLTYDIYENRLLKQFLWRQLLPRLDELEQRAQQEIRRRQHNLAVIRHYGWEDTETARISQLAEVTTNCQLMKRRVIGWGSLPFLQQVSLITLRTVPTQVLQKHPAYSRFYRVYLRFQRELKRGLNAEGFLTSIAMRKLSELYEVWSVFRLTQLLLKMLNQLSYQTVSSHGFFRVEDELFHFEVDRDAAVELTKGNKRVVIRYEPIYPPMDKVASGLVTMRRYQRTPDLALEVWQDGKPEHLLIFDAKYRAREEGGSKIFMDDDLDKMSAYASEFGWKSPHVSSRPRHIPTSAYIIYPGEVVEHNRDNPEVGALPIVPEARQQTEVYHALADLLRDADLV